MKNGNYGKKAPVLPVRPARKVNKKARGFGMGKINPTGIEGDEKKVLVDTFCQSRDPLFKIKGKERHRMLKGL